MGYPALQAGAGQPDRGARTFAERERTVAAALFSPLFYAVSNAIALARDPDATLGEILGSAAAVATSPLFDPAIYAARLHAKGSALAPGEAATLAHWVRTGWPLRIVPNKLYDEAHYLATYEDVAAQDEFGFVHFVLWGIHEGRLPNGWFDPDAYSRLNGTAAGQAPFAHYVAVGAALGAALPRRPAEGDAAEPARDGHSGAPSGGSGSRADGRESDHPHTSAAEQIAEQTAEQTARQAALKTAQQAAHLRAQRAAHLRSTELRQIFLPWFHAKLTGQPDGDPEALWQDYQAHGLAAEQPPHPLFDPQRYAAQIEDLALSPRRPDQPLVMHWLVVGQHRRVIPTHLFDEAHYKAVHPDIAGQKLGFMHYLVNGMREGRAPTIWFDQRWYSARYGGGEAEDYAHFVTEGLDAGRMPSALVEHIMQTFAPGRPLTRDIHNALLDASSSWAGTVPLGSLWLLVSLYVPAWHHQPASGGPTLGATLGATLNGPTLNGPALNGPALSATARTPLDGFVAYLGDGLHRDLAPGPLFDAALYRRRAAEAALPWPDPAASAVLHWLEHGCAARIVPTERFDEAFYRRSNPDIGRTALWGFAHFIRNGVFEGRAPNDRPAFRFLRTTADEDEDLPAFYRQWHSVDFAELSAADPAARTIRANQARLDALLRSHDLQQAFAAAQQVEPEVGDASSLSEYLLPPFHARLATAHAELRRRIPRTQYDTVLCVPWIRTGGADLVAGLLARALLRIRPTERILVLRTDQPHFERANWLPEAADVAAMADLTTELAPAEAQNLLRAVLRGVGARRVFNVNSRLCWTTMRMHGANLSQTVHTYAYMFCWDQTPSGLRAGYPAEFFADTVNTMTAFLTDTEYLRGELAAMYRLPRPLRERIVPLHTPAQTPVRPVAIARLVAQSASRKPLVLWAGRLDRQKRFDLVQEIARRMADVDFHCWGAALLDAPPDLSRLPANVTMRGSFDRFDDLPLEQAQAWLFTAAWEGMPTTVIELATRGVAIVASAVGGVPELIRPDTGWPVAADAAACAYVDALRDILDHPDEAAARAEALQRRVGSRYTEAVYDAALSHLLDAEQRA